MKKSRALILVFVGYALMLVLDFPCFIYGGFITVLIPMSFVGVVMMFLGLIDLALFKDRIVNFILSCLIVSFAALLTFFILVPAILLALARIFLGNSYQ